MLTACNPIWVLACEDADIEVAAGVPRHRVTVAGAQPDISHPCEDAESLTHIRVPAHDIDRDIEIRVVSLHPETAGAARPHLCRGRERGSLDAISPLGKAARYNLGQPGFNRV